MERPEAILRVERSVLGRQWSLRKFSERQALTLAQGLGIPELWGRLLAARKVSLENANDFLNPTLKRSLPDPSHLLDMDTAVERIVRAIENDESIAIFGDYDVDGATSSSLLWRFLTQVGARVQIYIPDRIKEGYGPNSQAFEKLRQQGVNLIITVDCGTTSHEVLSEAQQKKLDVIVIDHHIASAKLPPAVAIVNPNRIDESSPYTYLAAVGVSFLLAVGLNRLLRQKQWYAKKPEPDLMQLLDLVALGTVCDVMPLIGLNRTYVYQGLKIMSKRNNLGLKTLADIAGIRERPAAYHLGFVLGPRINAGGRVGEAQLGAKLLTTNNPDEANQIAHRLCIFNDKRKGIEEEVLRQATQQASKQEQPLIMVTAQGWHPGVIGIVAGRLKEKHMRPVFVIAQDKNGLGKGSGRSVPGIDLGMLVQAAKESGLLLAGGGHAMAAGLTVEKDKIAPLRDFFNERLKDVDLGQSNILYLDGVITPKAATTAWVASLERLGPYGVGNTTPRFAFARMKIAFVDVVGTEHVRCQFTDFEGNRLSAIAFRCVDTELGQFLLKKSPLPCHVVGTLRINDWQGRKTVQLTIEDIALESAEGSLAKNAA